MKSRSYTQNTRVKEVPEIPSLQVYNKFRRIFDVPLEHFKDIPLMAITWRFQFDIVKFDDYCRRYFGYSETQHGSLKNFVIKKFGEEAATLIEDLIDFGRVVATK